MMGEGKREWGCERMMECEMKRMEFVKWMRDGDEKEGKSDVSEMRGRKRECMVQWD